MVTLLAFIVLGGTAVAATGGNFILGKSNSASTATQLSSAAGNAFKVSDTNGGTGVYASGGNHSKNTAAVHGQSGAGNAVEGFSTANPASGVYGQDNNANSYGVAGHSDNGVAVVGDSSNGWAMQALGNATQTRTGGGFVKAMAFVDPQDTQAIRSSSASTPSVRRARRRAETAASHSAVRPANTRFDFGFQVSDRFVSVTAGPFQPNRIMSASGTNTHVVVHAFVPSVSDFAETNFYIFVY